MIKDITNGKNNFWDKEINLSLSLRDLQIIYDAVAELPFNRLRMMHETTSFKEELKDVRLLDNIFGELEDILIDYHGIVDNAH